MQESKANLLTAHAGAGDTEPNSPEFISYACLSKADMLEIDVNINQKSELIANHERCENGFLLDDLLAFYQEILKNKQIKPLYINFDLKVAGLEKSLKSLLQNRGLLSWAFFSGTVDWRLWQEPPKFAVQALPEVLFNVDEHILDFYQKYLKNGVNFLAESSEDLHRMTARTGIAKLNLNYKYVDKKLREFYCRAGLDLSVWTVDDAEAMAKFWQMGIFNLTTNKVEEAYKLRREICGC